MNNHGNSPHRSTRSVPSMLSSIDAEQSSSTLQGPPPEESLKLRKSGFTLASPQLTHSATASVAMVQAIRRPRTEWTFGMALNVAIRVPS